MKTKKVKKITKIEELEKRIEALESQRLFYIPVQPAYNPLFQNNVCPYCGKIGSHVCVTC